MDWMMPELSGVRVYRRPHATGFKEPIVLMTAKDDGADRVAGLDAGADN